MKFSVDPAAGQWFRSEFNLQPGAHIRIFTKIYGGIPTVYPKYYLGVTVSDADPTAPFQVKVADITFYIAANDAWILDTYDLNLKLVNDDVAYNFEPATE
ncbi:adhesin [Loigolactobacillus binensis]|uniref:Adhesin n=1 Tax=Loigolactobacillus binensis TaxID=2559922 RepID=A0ABW3EC55_9LACO|nr:adhesin [Loigolactobacillus binensis]